MPPPGRVFKKRKPLSASKKRSQAKWDKIWEKKAREDERYEQMQNPPRPEVLGSSDNLYSDASISIIKRWQGDVPADDADFRELGNSHCRSRLYDGSAGIPSLRLQCAEKLAQDAHNLSSEHLSQVPNWTVWRPVWDAILYHQRDSFALFSLFAASFHKHADFQCHYRGLLHPTKELTPRAAALRTFPLRGKNRHRMESISQELSVKDVRYLEVCLQTFGNQLVLNYTRDKLADNVLMALTRLKSLAVLDLRFIDVCESVLIFWKNTLLRGEWPQLRVVLLGHSNLDKLSYFLEIPQLWYVGYRGDRLCHPDWYTCDQDFEKTEVSPELLKPLKCASNHSSSWLYSSLIELKNQSQRHKVILELNFCRITWSSGELMSKPSDYIHCIRTAERAVSPKRVSPVPEQPQGPKRAAPRKRSGFNIGSDGKFTLL